jgi:hypothetical protein
MGKVLSPGMDAGDPKLKTKMVVLHDSAKTVVFHDSIMDPLTSIFISSYIP